MLDSRLLAMLLLVGCGPSEGQIAALTYNVHGLPPEITGDDTAARMALIAPLIVDYDLVGLQEDWVAENHDTLVADAPHPIAQWFDAKIEEDRVYGAGLDVLHGYEQLDYHEIHYETCNGVLDGASDCLASKGFQIARVKLGPGELDVYNTHHEAGGGAPDDAARSAQVDQVIAAMTEISGERAIVFMGDTNLEWDDPEDAPLLERYAAFGLIDACDAVGCPSDEIDRFLLRDGDALALEVLDWRIEEGWTYDGDVPLSDHPPVAVSLGWTRR